MADKFRMSFPVGAFIGDNEGIVDGSDIPAVPANINGRAVMTFADGAAESAMVSQSFSIPDANIWTSGSGAKLKIYFFGDGAGGGNEVDWEAAFECISPSDAHDMHAGGDFFAAAQTVQGAVDANAGELNVATVTFNQAQADAIEPEDASRIVIRRDSDDAGSADDYAEAVYVTHVDLYEVTV